MATWQDLKDSIDQIIKSNGNEEITGPLLNTVLKDLISNVGELPPYAGIATPSTVPGTPDGPVFYMASQAGTYANFDGIVVADNQSAILRWDGTDWHKEIFFTGDPTPGAVIIYEPGTQPVISSGDLTIDPANYMQSLFRPRLSSDTRAINTGFNLFFTNYGDSRVIHLQFVFTGTIPIQLESSVEVNENELPTGWTYDSGLNTLTFEAGTNDKVELSGLVDPDDSNKITLICGGIAV